MPRFFADECVARLIVAGLARAGFDVVDAKDVCQGDDDERVLALAAAAGRIVITDDWGFGEMTVRHGQPAAGVISLSLFALSAGARETYAVARIAEISDRATGQLTIIEPGAFARVPCRRREDGVKNVSAASRRGPQTRPRESKTKDDVPDDGAFLLAVGGAQSPVGWVGCPFGSVTPRLATRPPKPVGLRRKVTPNPTYDCCDEVRCP